MSGMKSYGLDDLNPGDNFGDGCCAVTAINRTDRMVTFGPSLPPGALYFTGEPPQWTDLPNTLQLGDDTSLIDAGPLAR